MRLGGTDRATWVAAEPTWCAVCGVRATEWAQPDLQLPTAQEAAEALFASTSPVWSLLAAERDVTMRMIGERLIMSFQHAHGGEYKQLAYVKDEAIAED